MSTELKLHSSRLSKGTVSGVFDAAAGIGEAALQSFLKAHYTKNIGEYSGQGEYPDLEIAYTWKVPQALQITLAPIPREDAEFYATERAKYLVEANPKLTLDRAKSLLEDNAPMVRIFCQEVDCTINFDSDSLKLSTSFTMLGDAQVVNGVLNITVTEAYIGDIQGLSKQISEKIESSKKFSQDPGTWEKLVKHIVNEFLKGDLPKVVERINLPNTITLIDGVALTDFNVNVEDKHVVVTANIARSGASAALVDSQVVDFTGQEQKHFQENAKKLERALLSPTDSAFFVLLGNPVFQSIANAYLDRTVSGSENQHPGDFRYSFNWSVTLSKASLAVQGAGVRGQANATGNVTNGSLWYKTWIHCTFTGTATVPGPVVVDAPLSVDSQNQVWVTATVEPFRPAVSINFGGWCGVADYPVGDYASGAAADYLSKHPITRHQRLFVVPDQFSATNVLAHIQLKSIDNVSGDLALSGDLSFSVS